MKLVIIIGSGAVGKMTVGQELMKLTGLRLFHNHMMIEPVLEIFGSFNSEAISRMRRVVFEEFLKTDQKGMIFTYMWAFDHQSDWDYIKSVTDLFEAQGGEVFYVELVADQKVRLERNRTENRLRNKASKRNLSFSENNILNEDQKYRLVSHDGELLFEHYMKIDNTNLEAEEAASMIQERFGL